MLGYRKKSLEGIKKKQQKQAAGGSDDSEVEDPGAQDDKTAAAQESSEDEAEYYRQAVGEDPDEGNACLLVMWVHSRSHLGLDLRWCALDTDFFFFFCSPRFQICSQLRRGSAIPASLRGLLRRGKCQQEGQPILVGETGRSLAQNLSPSQDLEGKVSVGRRWGRKARGLGAKRWENKAGSLGAGSLGAREWVGAAKGLETKTQEKDAETSRGGMQKVAALNLKDQNQSLRVSTKGPKKEGGGKVASNKRKEGADCHGT